VTRLAEKDVRSIPADLDAYDAELNIKTGSSLVGLACHAAGLKEAEVKDILGSVLVGVIPVTGGEGIISGFCNAVKSIVSHLGCRAFVTQAADVAGLAEAFERKADIILLSDDQCFIALHTQSHQVIENAAATGKGFVAGLNLMAGDLKARNVLVLGCGPVGHSAAEELIGKGSHVSIYDIDSSRSNQLFEKIKRSVHAALRIAEEPEGALMAHRLIIDATPAADIIRAQHITADTYISAPGVPLGLDDKARLKIGSRLLHDPLQIGVATMILCTIKLYTLKKVN
jgi:pyrrolysine biosynthesis protein PylD